MSEKVTGYLFIVVGLTIAGFAAFSVYSVFTAKTMPVSLFTFDAVTIPLGALLGGGEVPVEMVDTNIEIFPAEILKKTTNTFAHLFLMGFIASIGFRVAQIGATLVRPIIVKADGKKMASILDPKSN
jgi:hypothetical protein